MRRLVDSRSGKVVLPIDEFSRWLAAAHSRLHNSQAWFYEDFFFVFSETRRPVRSSASWAFCTARARAILFFSGI